MEVLPRAEPKVLLGLLRVKTPWDFMTSVFAPYKPDTAKILNECFLFDWDKIRVEKLLKGEKQLYEVKEYCMKNYKVIRDVYKQYSGEQA